MNVVPDHLLSTGETCRLGGITFRQLDYWCRAGVLLPTVDGKGSGSRRSFGEGEVRVIRDVLPLARLGVAGCGADTSLMAEVAAVVRANPSARWVRLDPLLAAGSVFQPDNDGAIYLSVPS